MGHELFDHAFMTYAQRWKFKHPTPEDFFRTMEDASAVDLDWFWRGWFYTTDYVDIGIADVKQYYVTDEKPKENKETNIRKGRFGQEQGPFVYMITDGKDKAFDKKEVKLLNDFVNEKLSADDKAKLKQPKYFYELTFNKPGGMLMPVIVQLNYEDGTSETQTFPVQIWRKNNQGAIRVIATDRKVVKFQLDPKLQTADIDVTNNMWPREAVKTKFD